MMDELAAQPQRKAAPREPLISPGPEPEPEIVSVEEETPVSVGRGWQRGALFAAGALAGVLLVWWIATGDWRDVDPNSATGTESVRLEDPGDVAASKPAESVPVRREPEPQPVAPLKPSEPVAGDAQDGPHGMRFHYVPAGEYVIGSPPGEEGRYRGELQHSVKLTRGFWIAESEVTQKQWHQVMGTEPSYFPACGDDCPVERVNWYEALEFANALSTRQGLDPCYELEGCTGESGGGCPEGPESGVRCLELYYEVEPGGGVYCHGAYECTTADLTSLDCRGYRLPTEAEWEVAARAGESGAIYTGSLTLKGDCDAPELDAIAWYCGNSGVRYDGGYDCIAWYCGNSGVRYDGGYDCSAWPDHQIESVGTHPVRLKDANGWGLYDMLGNVLEWTADAGTGRVTDTYTDGIADPLDETGSRRVVRGGDWLSSARGCRSASRGSFAPGDRRAYVGFRLVRTAP